jgi:uncharacterized protein DUF4432
MRSCVRVVDRGGWNVVRMTCPPLVVDVVPGKGGDILSVRWLPLDVNLLWESPWGLRPRAVEQPAGDSVAAFLESYPGGWQTIFPNGGDAAVEQGVEWGFHGEASLVGWDDKVVEDGPECCSLRLSTKLSASPFELERTLTLDAGGLVVSETARNTSAVAREAMWSHHPAFGAPLISGVARLDCGAAAFVADDERDVTAGDLEPGAMTPWPNARTRDGRLTDLRVVPPDGPALDRFGYLTGFERGWASIANDEIGLAVRLDWDAGVFPCAWYWLEARATQGYPWFGDAYVLAIEPASTWPGQGIAAARRKGNGPMRFEAGDARTIEMRLSVSEVTRP